MINTKTTKPELLAIANNQAHEISELQKQQRVLFVITGLLFISHYLF